MCRVGTEIDYSLALHPYGLPLATGDIKLTVPYAGMRCVPHGCCVSSADLRSLVGCTLGLGRCLRLSIRRLQPAADLLACKQVPKMSSADTAVLAWTGDVLGCPCLQAEHKTQSEASNLHVNSWQRDMPHIPESSLGL